MPWPPCAGRLPSPHTCPRQRGLSGGGAAIPINPVTLSACPALHLLCWHTHGEAPHPRGGGGGPLDTPLLAPCETAAVSLKVVLLFGNCLPGRSAVPAAAAPLKRGDRVLSVPFVCSARPNPPEPCSPGTAPPKPWAPLDQGLKPIVPKPPSCQTAPQSPLPRTLAAAAHRPAHS